MLFKLKYLEVKVCLVLGLLAEFVSHCGRLMDDILIMATLRGREYLEPIWVRSNLSSDSIILGQ